MAELPEVETQTVAAIYAAKVNANKQYDSIGIGPGDCANECDRYIWNSYRWVSEAEKFTGQQLLLFESGNEYERRIIAELKAAGIAVTEVDPDTKKQFKVFALGGHVRGKMDGKAINVPEAPKTEHIVEAKSHNEKSYTALKKKGVKESKPAHYAQCQIYMHLTGIKRALYVAAAKNTDHRWSDRIEYDKKYCETILARLERIINAPKAPARICNNPEKYPCMLCKHVDVCHGSTFARRNCRTCLSATPVIIEGETEAKWKCEKFNKWLPLERQKVGCSSHLYVPDLVPGKQIDVGPDWVAYEMKNGERWVDRPQGESNPVTRYWYNSESECVFEAIHGADCEELTVEEYAEAKAYYDKLKEKDARTT